MSKTKIVILQMRELIYTAIFVGLGIFLLALLFIMFWPAKGSKSNHTSVGEVAEQNYEAGVYTKEVEMGDAQVNVQVSLDKNCVKSVELVNLDESISTMYPLMEPTVEKISKQLAAGKSVEEVVVSDDSQYTEKVILETVNEMMKEHQVE